MKPLPLARPILGVLSGMLANAFTWMIFGKKRSITRCIVDLGIQLFMAGLITYLWHTYYKPQHK